MWQRDALGIYAIQNDGVSSKYDPFWTDHLEQIREGIRLAVTRGQAAISLSGIRDLGERHSWQGTADVRGHQVMRSSMAHVTSLARIVASSGICELWPERIIHFAIGSVGDELTISATVSPPTSISAKPLAVPWEESRDISDRTQGESRGRQDDTDAFYSILDQLAHKEVGPRLLRDSTGDSGWPSHGVYFFYERGELRLGGTQRVVRIGTHSLTEASQTTLWDRLRQHRGHIGGRNAGGGNHRASVFRRHVGAALIRREGLSRDLLDSWLDRHNPNPEMAALEATIELEVSRYIGDMPFLWLAVPERSDRDFIERHSIALLSCRVGGLDIPSDNWLGHDAEREQIRDSGLWNVGHVDLAYDPEFLGRLVRLA